MTTPDLIRAIGTALFGTHWQTDLGDHLGVNRRTVQRWLTGEDEPRPGVWPELEALLRERAAAQLGLCEAIRGRGIKELSAPAEVADSGWPPKIDF